MKTPPFLAVAGFAAALFSVAAQAQTGRPSVREVPAAADTPQVVATDAQVGSYARYLMLNGRPRAEAIVAARNIDHPAVRVSPRTLAASLAATQPATAR
jgi:hypothetical protein